MVIARNFRDHTLEISARNVLGREDPVCNENGYPIDLERELRNEVTNSREADHFIKRVVRSVQLMECKS